MQITSTPIFHTASNTPSFGRINNDEGDEEFWNNYFGNNEPEKKPEKKGWQIYFFITALSMGVLTLFSFLLKPTQSNSSKNLRQEIPSMMLNESPRDNLKPQPNSFPQHLQNDLNEDNNNPEETND